MSDGLQAHAIEDVRPAASDDEEPETAQEPGPEAAATGAVEAAEAEDPTKGPLAAALASAGSAVDSAISAAKEALRGSAPPDDSAPDAAAHDDTAAQPEAAAPQVIAAAQAEAASSGDIGEGAPAAAPPVARAQVPASASKPPAGPSKPSADEEAARRRGRRAADVEEAEGHLATLKHGERAEPRATFGERPPSSNKFRARSGAVHARTFTARPAAPCPRRAPKLDFSHSPAQLERIENETRSLVTRLERVYGRDVGSTVRHASPPRGLPCNEAPHSRNRRAAAQKVAVENLAIYHRLQRVRPSPETSAGALRREWATAQRYAANCSRYRSPARRSGGKGRAPPPAVTVPTVAEQT